GGGRWGGGGAQRADRPGGAGAAPAYGHVGPPVAARTPRTRAQTAKPLKLQIFGAVRVLRCPKSHVAPGADDPDHAVRGESLPLYRPELAWSLPGLHGDQAPGARRLRLGRDALGERQPQPAALWLAVQTPRPAVLRAA